MPKNKLRVEPNERIDIQDFQYLINAGIHDNTEQLLERLMCSTTRTKKWILSGFTMSWPGAKQLQVTKGKAILAERRDGAVRYGMLVTEGDATKIIDLNTYSAGDYGIYIRFEPVAGEDASRIFWNPAGDGSEYASSIQTRYQANWSLRVDAASPGAEWLRIGEVAQATMDITDEREFYFEGSLPDSYESGWSADGGGIANDRNADRATYGITDLQGFTAATRQCLTDIKGRGLREWYERDIGGMNIGFDADPVEGRLAIGDAYFNFELNTSNPRFNLDQYDYLEYTRSANTLKVVLDTVDIFSFSETALLPLGTQNIGGSSNRWNTGYFDGLNGKVTVIQSNDVTGGTGAPDAPLLSTGGSVTNAANVSSAANGGSFYGGGADGTGGGGVGVYGMGGLASNTGDAGSGGYFRGGTTYSTGMGGYGVYGKGGPSVAAGTAGYGGYFEGGTPSASSGDNGVYGLLGKGGPGEGSGLGGAGVRGEGGDGGASGIGGVGGSFYGADSNGSASGGIGIAVQGGAGVSGQDSGWGLLLSTQTITTATGLPGLGGYIEAGSINHASNSNSAANGLEVNGGNVTLGTGAGQGGIGVKVGGGDSYSNDGGDGVYALGGTANGGTNNGGSGVDALGGIGHYGGIGVKGTGATADEDTHHGGDGGYFAAGDGQTTGNGGDGIVAIGGEGGASGESGVGARIAGVATAGRVAANIRLITIGADPTVLTSGDIWFDGSAIKCRIGSTTYTLAP